MKSFLETIRIFNGVPQHLEWHQQRVDATMQHFYPVHKHSWNLKDCIDVPVEHQSGLVRCRIVYDAHLFSIHYFRYSPRTITTLKLVEAPSGFDYRFKYADRSVIEELYGQRQDADDVLITKGGWITDTSIANIAFEKNGQWYSPSIPLLAGTTWKRLVVRGVLISSPIHVSQLRTFDSFKIFNAMNDWETGLIMKIENILT